MATRPVVPANQVPANQVPGIQIVGQSPDRAVPAGGQPVRGRSVWGRVTDVVGAGAGWPVAAGGADVCETDLRRELCRVPG